MNLTEIYDKLQEYTALATGLDAKTQITFANIAGQDQLLKPYVVIALRSFKQMGTALKKELSIDGIEESTLLMKGVVSFQCFGKREFQAEEYLGELALKFNTELSSEIFMGKLAKQRTLKEVTAMPNFRDSQLEYRAIYEIEIAFNKTVCHKVGFIEKIELNRETITIP